MEPAYDVTAIGEVLIDFTHSGTSAQGNGLYEANPGGAPCNVLAMLARLGHRTAFIGKAGNDLFGTQLKETLGSLGIGTEGLALSGTERTTLAFVKTADDGERSFSFYRTGCADCALKADEVNMNLIKQSRILHYGTLSLTDEPAASATRAALEAAKQAGALRSFDPNLRLPLWDSPGRARKEIWYGVSQCDILKIAEEELEFLTGEADIGRGVQKIRDRHAVPLITVTRGKNGCEGFFDDGTASARAESGAFTSVQTIDTTGAGDTFCACILHEILENGYGTFSSGRLANALRFACAAASLTTTRKGALAVMPEKAEIEALLERGA
ncbi:MAG: carbohydrate kinase [Treponemataceae bacterium]|nr:carbohydrate kinase [Treponemataceae bacterium]